MGGWEDGFPRGMREGGPSCGSSEGALGSNRQLADDLTHFAPFTREKQTPSPPAEGCPPHSPEVLASLFSFSLNLRLPCRTCAPTQAGTLHANA